jgi:hypothetical protein
MPSHAEAELYEAFREQLPDDVLVLHSFAWLECPRGWPPRDAESDFVVLDPNRGILVVEVKGGSVLYDPQRGWHGESRSGPFPITDPFEQGRKGKFAVLHELQENKRWPRPKIVLGHAAFFPDITGKDQFVQRPDVVRAIVGDRTDIHSLDLWIRGVFAWWRGDGNQLRALGADGLSLAEEVFCSRIEVRPLLSQILAVEEEHRIELTEQQSRILEVLAFKHRAVVQGGAGTGKTVIAAELARRCTSADLRTAVLCYNAPLASVLQRSLAGTGALVLDYHAFCHWAVREAEREHSVDMLALAEREFPGEGFFTVQLPFALLTASEYVTTRFDAIIVDEGQDFSKDYWMSIRMFLKDEAQGYLHIFADDNQLLYQDTTDYPMDYHFSPLRQNCRNTDAIHDLAYCYYDHDESTSPPGIPGHPIEVLMHPSIGTQACGIARAVQTLIRNHGLRRSDIAVLTPSLSKNAYADALAQFAQFEIGDAESADSNLVRLDTVKRFKGLEAQLVFLWDPIELESEVGRELLYVGFSRAKSRLIVVGDARTASFIGDRGIPLKL